MAFRGRIITRSHGSAPAARTGSRPRSGATLPVRQLQRLAPCDHELRKTERPGSVPLSTRAGTYTTAQRIARCRWPAPKKRATGISVLLFERTLVPAAQAEVRKQAQGKEQ